MGGGNLSRLIFLLVIYHLAEFFIILPPIQLTKIMRNSVKPIELKWMQMKSPP